MKSTCVLPPLSDILLHDQKPYSRSVLQVSSLLSSPSDDCNYYDVKAKRKRASPSQLAVLNRVFQQTYFPSTELRIDLGKQLGMSPRTVQIWFQNKRQSIRMKKVGSQQNQNTASYYYPHGMMSPPISPPLNNYSSSPKNMFISLPPLRLPPPSPTYSPLSSGYPSPTSLNSILLQDS
jgi:hypothetical protein